MLVIDKGAADGITTGASGVLLCGGEKPAKGGDVIVEEIMDESGSRVRARGLEGLLCCKGARVVFEVVAAPHGGGG